MPVGNAQHMCAYRTWEPGLAVATKPQLVRPLHDVLAFAEVLDVVEPAALHNELLLRRPYDETFTVCSGRRMHEEVTSIRDAAAAPDQAATQRRAARLVLLHTAGCCC